MFAVRQKEGAVGEELAALQWFEVAAQLGGGCGFRGVFLGTWGVPGWGVVGDAAKW
ncbi:hypothetical protein [Laspinema palackyanum]|uniref:hypothetical protein n=1 Tax=Laspinema palackyanum TaxID=3231601 RepID=UPI00345DEA36|nr:hypothetical protein [Laspinema sp. D2c]